MCGIVGVIAERNVTPILLEGLRRLEYRGYDSAGIALLDQADHLQCTRTAGKVQALAQRLAEQPLRGSRGIAHTRWATHGVPSELNAHPHISGDIAVIHNGIIENHGLLREQLLTAGYVFQSETDTEVVAHLIHFHRQREGSLLTALQKTVALLEGAYSLGVISQRDPDHLLAARQGSPLVIGIGIGEHFLASDVFALAPVTQRFVFLDDGDVAVIERESFVIYDQAGAIVERPETTSQQSGGAGIAEKGNYRHYMQKEIFEQPAAVASTLEGRIYEGRLADSCFGFASESVFERIKNLHIVACGTSYHAGLIARHWLEGLGIPCNVEVASEYRYRDMVMPEGTLFVSISQSGETADTLAALREAKKRGCMASLGICNIAESSLVRESDFAFLTRAGREIGVASTKAFTTQLCALRLLTIALARYFSDDPEREKHWVNDLQQLPNALERVLRLDDDIEKIAEHFLDKRHALFLGRGTQYPVAMEGALKLKEISYIHAEAYPAGELKHGPLALVDEDMPVICVLPKNGLLEKLLSNLQEVRARGGELYLFADSEIDVGHGLDNFGTASHSLSLGSVAESVAPIIFTVPLQLLAYHVAVLKGTDVDQPRNLAKSVTVE